jgi:hypothetical protein
LNKQENKREKYFKIIEVLEKEIESSNYDFVSINPIKFIEKYHLSEFSITNKFLHNTLASIIFFLEMKGLQKGYVRDYWFSWGKGSTKRYHFRKKTVLPVLKKLKEEFSNQIILSPQLKQLYKNGSLRAVFYKN